MGRRLGGSGGLSLTVICVALLALSACDQKSDADKAAGAGKGTAAPSAAAGSNKGAAPAPTAAASADAKTESDGVNRFNGKPYKIYPDGKVDFDTYLGGNLYGNICFRCHGENGNGSSFAPSLVSALQNITYEKFVDVVTNGITAIDPSQTEVMPSFGDSPTVMKYIDAIYAFLKLCSDGKLPAGELEWTGPKNE